MSRYYVNERARYGGVTGTIIPFPQQLPAGNDPSTGNWRSYLPSGYLRCDGSVYNKDLYPVLAQVLGLGDNSKFLKPDQEIGADEFVLPDLGSKYISGSSSSGTILNSKINNPDSNQGYRVGAEVEITSLVGDTQTITYGGSFELVPFAPKSFIGNPQFKTITSDGRTLTSFLSEQEFQAHGHTANVGVFTYLGNWTDGIYFSNGGQARGGNDAQNEGGNQLVFIQNATGAEAVVGHSHIVNLPNTSTVKDDNELVYQLSVPPGSTIDIDPIGLSTTVTITTSSIYKLDEVTPPYILMEYIIKI